LRCSDGARRFGIQDRVALLPGKCREVSVWARRGVFRVATAEPIRFSAMGTASWAHGVAGAPWLRLRGLEGAIRDRMTQRKAKRRRRVSGAVSKIR